MEEKEVKQTTSYLEIQEEIPPVIPDLAEPPEGKVWRRKSDGFIVYGSMVLGIVPLMVGKKRSVTLVEEKPEDYELIDIPDDSGGY